jgi:molecular chaperone Hsp33
MERALMSLGRDDLKQIIEEDGQAELSCHFCNSRYTFTKAELEAILREGAGA